MSNALASLASAGAALGVYDQALDVVQANIANASTPGYAKQSPMLVSQPFDITGGLVGGVAMRGIDSARDEYAEAEVRRQVQQLGRLDSQVQGTTAIESQFDVSGDSGVSARLDSLFQAFSGWSVSPNSDAARQRVISAASQFATSVRQVANALSKVSSDTQNQIESTVGQVNQLSATIRDLNIKIQRQGSANPGLQANLHSAVEQLSQLVDVSTIAQPDGTMVVLLSGGSPLVDGATQYPISASLSIGSTATVDTARASSRILDSAGSDITGQLQGGKLGGLLDIHNRALAALIGDDEQAGSINQFAARIADAVNGILQSGYTSAGAGAASGAPLFVYDGSNPTAAGSSLTVNPGLAASDLAPVDASGNANGNALRLAGMADSAADGGIDGATFSDFFSRIVMSVGSDSAAAKQDQQFQSQLVAQTRQLRDAAQGVSLDEQAVMLIQFQKNYQAAGRFLTTLNDLLETAINIIR